MLVNTFLHIPYVSEKTEQRLWREGIMTWDDILDKEISIHHSDIIKRYVLLSKENYLSKNHEFFSRRLLSKYHWRAYDDFKDNTCFLDIETTGLDRNRDELTVIGLYTGTTSKVFINGINMDAFKDEIKKYSFIVTFNGALFDLPFIRTKFPDLTFNHFHADLRFIMRRLGYTGGLKKIEKSLGIQRESDLDGMTGLDAVRLWHKYKRENDKKALDTLVRYNTADIRNLKTMIEFAYPKLKSYTLAKP